MATYTPVVDPVTPAWLTAVLRDTGGLTRGEVIRVDLQKTGAFNSSTSHLTLAYSPDAPVQIPTRLVLKRNIDAQWAKEAGEREVGFYTCVAGLPTHPRVVVPCYAAAFDQPTGNSYLLLRDESATHAPPVTRAQQVGIVESVPAQAYLETIVDALAELHAFWWQSPLLSTEVARAGRWFEESWPVEHYVGQLQMRWDTFSAQEGNSIPEDWRRIYERTLTGLRPFWERYLEPRFQAGHNLTLGHGDAYCCNFLCPRIPGQGPTYLLDWQSPEVNIGAIDLVNMCASFWTQQQRLEGRREEMLLRRYRDNVLAHGVKDFSLDDLHTDYRIGLIDWIFYPVWDSNNGSDRDYWQPKMRCLLEAFQDWECETLLVP
jgi:aminoglycoside phosphotransferase (APT) family kinase protein